MEVEDEDAVFDVGHWEADGVIELDLVFGEEAAAADQAIDPSPLRSINESSLSVGPAGRSLC